MSDNKPEGQEDKGGSSALSVSALRDLNIILDSLPALLLEVDLEGKIHEYRAPKTPLKFVMTSKPRPSKWGL